MPTVFVWCFKTKGGGKVRSADGRSFENRLHSCCIVMTAGTVSLFVLIISLIFSLSMLNYSGVIIRAVIFHVMGSVSFVGDAVTSLSNCILFTI